LHWVVLILIVLFRILVKLEIRPELESSGFIDAAQVIAAVLPAYHLAETTVRVL